MTELIPARDPDSKRLMVVLHGLGDSMDGYRWMPSELRLPWLNYLLVNAPDDYYAGYSWFDIYGDASEGVERSRKLLFELLDDLPNRGFVLDQTMVFGFSQGCLMTVEVGARYPEKLTGLVGVSGYVHQPATLLEQLSPVAKEQRFLMTHGTLDPLIPFEPAKTQFEQLKAAGLQIEWHVFQKEHTIAGEQELGVIRAFVSGCFAED